MIYPDELKKYYVTNHCMGDGFGSQFHHIIAYLLFCFKFDLNFIYSSITRIEHNYQNEQDFINKLENLMNIYPFFTNIEDEKIKLEPKPMTDMYDKAFCNDFHVKYLIDQNVDDFATEESLGKIRTMFWANKNKNEVFNNGKTNVAVHIRRANSHDNDIQNRMNIENEYFLNAIQRVRGEHKDKDLLFHIYSQGELNTFEVFKSNDIILHINEDLCKTFIDLVGADILVTSSSALSFSAAFLNSGIIYFTNHCHPPRHNWIRL